VLIKGFVVLVVLLVVVIKIHPIHSYYISVI
jgi:hypothetical protein